MKTETHEIQSKNLRAPSDTILRMYIFLLFAGVAFLFLPTVTFGEDLAKYRAQVVDAKVATEELISTTDDDEEMSPSEFKDYERRTVARIRVALPPSETVEWQESSIETDNSWLADKLDEYERRGENASQKSAAILNEIDERLNAIERKLDELATPSSSAAANRTKDEDKQKLAEILRRKEYQKPEEKPESFFARTYRKFREWLNEKFPRASVPQTPSTEGVQSASYVLQILLYALVLGVIGFLIYRFAPLLIGKYKSREKREKREQVILGETIAADETAGNLFSEAETLARAGDLRGAIRKGYIALLFDLGERKIIGLARHKTNRDYLRDLQRPARADLYENVRGLTQNFERHWYGFREVEAKDWEEFRNEYNRTVSGER